MFQIINFFIFLILIIFSFEQEIDYELACVNIYYKSKKDCNVAPRYDNYRCCYVTYNEDGQDKEECAFIYDSADEMEKKVDEYNKQGKDDVEIECNSNYIRVSINIIGIIFFIFYFLL